MGAPVTDHAVLRWLERVQGVDIEAIRQRIWKTCEPAVKAGATCVRVDGVKYELANGKVVTVVPGHAAPGKTSRDATQRKLASENGVAG
jgi:hypothetical protein